MSIALRDVRSVEVGRHDPTAPSGRGATLWMWIALGGIVAVGLVEVLKRWPIGPY